MQRSIVYRMQDQSFILFGYIHSSYFGFAHVDRLLRSAREFEPISRSKPFKASGQPVAMAPTGNAGEFVTATNVLVWSRDQNHPETLGAPSNFHRGTVLDFVKLN